MSAVVSQPAQVNIVTDAAQTEKRHTDTQTHKHIDRPKETEKGVGMGAG